MRDTVEFDVVTGIKTSTMTISIDKETKVTDFKVNGKTICSLDSDRWIEILTHMSKHWILDEYLED